MASKTVIHKTEVGGVKVVEKKKADQYGSETYRGLYEEQLQQAIARNIRGVLMLCNWLIFQISWCV